MLKNSELKEYLNAFPDDAPISIILANPRKRKLYSLENIFYFTDQGQPVFCIDVGVEKDMDQAQYWTQRAIEAISKRRDE